MVMLLASTATGQTPPPSPDHGDLKLKARLNEMLARAKAAREVGDWTEAIAVLQEATTLDPSRDLLWAKLGEAYQGAKQYQDAATAYQKAIGIKPIGAYYNNLGEACRSSGAAREAVQAYRKAVEADPSDAFQYYFNIGALLTNAGDLDGANAAYDEAMRSNPQFALAYYFKSTNLLSKAQTLHGKATAPDETFRLLHKYLELQPTGRYAVPSQQLLDFLGRDIRTTYTREPPGEQGQALEETVSEAASHDLLGTKVQPVYPELARNARIPGR